MKENVLQLGEDIVSLSAHIAAATQRLLDMIRRFDEARGWECDGRTSCADWLNWKTGTAMSTAYEHVRVAHRLAELPRADEAFGRGALSYTKVRAISRVANEENEASLLEDALQLTGQQLEQHCRSQADGEVLRGRREPERHVRQRTLGDGTVEICVRLLADEAELVMKALAEARRERSSADPQKSLPRIRGRVAGQRVHGSGDELGGRRRSLRGQTRSAAFLARAGPRPARRPRQR